MKDDKKTFADLFSSSNKKSTSVDGEGMSNITFGNLVVEEESVDDNSIVKNNSEVDNSQIEVNNAVEDVDSDFSFNDVVNDDSVDENVDEITNDVKGISFFDNEIDDSLDDKEQRDESTVVNDVIENDSGVDDTLNLQDKISFFGDDSDDSLDNSKQVNENTVVGGAVENDSNVDENKTVLSDVKDDIVNDSASPFFQDEGAGVVSNDNNNNPMLLGTLNLVENENEEKMVNSIDVSKSRHFDVKIVKKKEPLFHVIIGILSYALFIWLLLVGIVLLIYVLDIKIRASKGDYSAPTYNAYVVLTGSMLPKIQVYDVVVTKKVDAADLKVGDVITFASADTRFLNTIITHRIIKKNYDPETKMYSFQTRGDNNNVADSALVPQNNIYGRVFLKIPKLGYLQEFLASDGGWIIVILIPCLAVISYDIVKLAKGLKRKKYKNIKVQK